MEFAVVSGSALILANLTLSLAFGGPQSHETANTAIDQLPPITIYDHPAELGRRLVADWEVSGPTLMVFTRTWAPTLTEVASLLGGNDSLFLAREEVTSRQEATAWHQALPQSVRTRVKMLDFPVDTPWIRDYGPLQVETAQGTLWLDTLYLTSRPADDRAPRTFARLLGHPVDRVSWRLEGGSIVSNGDGFCVATYEYAEDNDLLSRLSDEYRRLELLSRIGCKTLVLVPALRNENTRHVDMFVHFTSRETVLIGDIDPSEDPQDSMRLDVATLAIAEAARTRGYNLSIHRIPFGKIDDEIYYTYLNLLPLGDLLLIPSYDDVAPSRQASAWSAVQAAVPERQVVQVPADAMIELEGALHCAAITLHRPG